MGSILLRTIGMPVLTVILAVIAFFGGMYIPYVNLTKEYACKIDTFYGVAECFRITNREECNGDRNLLQVQTPYGTNYSTNEEDQLVQEPSLSLCINRDGYEIKKGIMQIEGYEF